ncbi:DNA-directed RNA polymerase subunit alpha C-terminal domain-containing protein, partial [Chloroflexota bacterium]
ELYLATLDSPEARLYVEFDVELSKGYREAESSDNLPVGVIPVDAIFTPTRKVNFTVEPIHIGQETSRERLYLEVWTDGTISPADTISRSAEILMEQLSPFVGYTRISQIEEVTRLPIPEEQYNMPVEQLDLSVRTLNCLRRASIATVGELVSKTEKEMMALRNFGQKSRREIVERLEGLELSLVSLTKDGEEEEESTEQEEAAI